MKITIDEITFEKIIKATKNCVAVDNSRPILQQIKLVVKTDKITAYSLDGYTASKITIPHTSDEEFTVFFPPFNFKASKGGIRTVTISTDGDVAEIEIGTPILTEQIYRFKQPNNPEKAGVDIEKIYEANSDHTGEIAFNAGYMARAFNNIKAAITDNRYKYAVMQLKNDPLRPIIIKGKDENVVIEELVLPIKIRG